MLPVPQVAFLGSYLFNPSSGRRDAWHVAAPRDFPDWFGNNGSGFLQAAFTPGTGDYGGYSSPATDSIISRALAAASARMGAGRWAQAQRQIMSDAAAIPLDNLRWPIYHASAVHGCNFWWVGDNCDPTNVWLSS